MSFVHNVRQMMPTSVGKNGTTGSGSPNTFHMFLNKAKDHEGIEHMKDHVIYDIVKADEVNCTYNGVQYKAKQCFTGYVKPSGFAPIGPVSKGYNIINDKEVVDLMYDAFKDADVNVRSAASQVNGSFHYALMLDTGKWADGWTDARLMKDPYNFMILARNNSAGKAAFTLNTGALQFRCGNGLVMGTEVMDGMSIQHIGERYADSNVTAIKGYFGKVLDFIDDFYAIKTVMLDTKVDVTDLPMILLGSKLTPLQVQRVFDNRIGLNPWAEWDGTQVSVDDIESTLTAYITYRTNASMNGNIKSLMDTMPLLKSDVQRVLDEGNARLAKLKEDKADLSVAPVLEALL